MTAEQAKDLLEEFKKCPDPGMKQLQQRIRNRVIGKGFRRLPPLRGGD
jgi:hypothetical protein